MFNLYSRMLIIVGSIFLSLSIYQTLGHINAPSYEPHAWYHFFREGMGDVIKMFLIIWIFFGGEKLRTKESWKFLLVIMIAIFAPYWIGMPFNFDLRAPHMVAEINHVIQASCMFLGLALAKKEFYRTK